MLKVSVQQATGVVQGFVIYWDPTAPTVPKYVCMAIKERKELFQIFSQDETVEVINSKVSVHSLL